MTMTIGWMYWPVTIFIDPEDIPAELSEIIHEQAERLGVELTGEHRFATETEMRFFGLPLNIDIEHGFTLYAFQIEVK